MVATELQRESQLQRVVSSASVWITFGILLFLTGRCGHAQSPSTVGTELYAGDFVKWVETEFPVTGNRWNLLRLSLSNSHDRPVDLQVTVYFDVDDTLQYSRRVQIPPSTRVRTWLPILIPDSKHIVDRGFPYHVLVRSLGDSTGLIPDRFGAMQLDRFLPVASNEPTTGVIHTFPEQQILDTEFVESTDVGALDCLLTARFNNGLDRNWKTLSPGFAAGSETGLQALDQIVLANDELLDDPKGQNALRRWLFGGGHLWVMLDRADSRNLELILGDRYQGQELERVELTRVELVDDLGRTQSNYEYDTPVRMTRVLIDDVDLLYSVDGWPAAFSIDYGQGQVLVTTLAGKGWGRSRLPTDPATPADTEWQARAVPLPAFGEIASRFLSVEEESLDLDPVLTKHVEGFIGFQIPSRASVIGILIGYALLSVAVAVWLWSTSRLPWFGALGPALALLAAAALAGMRPAGRDVPPTAVFSQVVTPITGSDDVLDRGIVGFYAADSSPLNLSGDHNARMSLDMEGFGSGIRILTYDDEFHWHWENLRNQPGLHTAQYAWSGPMERIEAVATPNERGISGTLSLPEGMVPEDAIIDSIQGRIGVHFNGDGQWTALPSDTLSKEQFLGAELLGDEQRRRVATLQALLTTLDRPWNPRPPHLLFWTPPTVSGLNFDDRFQRQGATLVAVPLQWNRPPAGSRITIPAPLLPYREVTGPDGKPPVGLYNRRQLEWMKKEYATSTWLGFDVPDELLPLSLNTVEVRIGVTGPVGQLELMKWDGQQLVSLRSWENPVGTLSATFDEDSGLSVSEDGKLLLFLTAGQGSYDPTASQEGPRSYWRIESFDLSLEATTIEPEP